MFRLKRLARKVTRIFYLGISEDMPFAEVQKTFLFNLFLMIGLPFIIAGIPINFSNGQFHLAWYNCVLLSLYTTGLYINAIQRHLWVRQLVFVLASIVFMVGLVFFRNGTEYNMLITLIAAVILFDNWLFIVHSLFVIVCVTYIRLRDADLLAIRSFAQASPHINMFYTQFLFVLSVYAFKYIYFKYQEQLNDAYLKLKQSNETKDRILSVVAHDLRTPVSGISSLSQMLIDKQAAPKDEKTYMEMIHDASRQSLTLISELLSDHTSHSDNFVFSKTDIALLVSQVFELMQHKALEKEQVLKLSVYEEPVWIEADAQKLLRVFQNLVSNAIKFTHKHGEIAIHVKRNGEMAEVGIRDNGIGIPAVLLQQLYSMSSEIKRKGTAGESSFGLGLHVSRQAVETHRGKILVESTEGRGSLFTVLLPALR